MEGQNHICIKAMLVAKREEQYTVYVFQDIDKEDEYLMCTKCPNWNGQEIDLFQEGYLSYKFVVAGRDTWYKSETGEFFAYQWTAHYFLDFVPITHVLANGRVSEHERLIIT
jgi:hypothetical protein